MKELRTKIKVWLKENDTEYYGLDRDSVNTALWEFEDVLDKVEEMQKAIHIAIKYINEGGYSNAEFVLELALKGEPL